MESLLADKVDWWNLVGSNHYQSVSSHYGNCFPWIKVEVILEEFLGCHTIRVWIWLHFWFVSLVRDGVRRDTVFSAIPEFDFILKLSFTNLLAQISLALLILAHG